MYMGVKLDPTLRERKEIDGSWAKEGEDKLLKYESNSQKVDHNVYTLRNTIRC